jgi:threonine dehydratase
MKEIDMTNNGYDYSDTWHTMEKLDTTDEAFSQIVVPDYLLPVTKSGDIDPLAFNHSDGIRLSTTDPEDVLAGYPVSHSPDSTRGIILRNEKALLWLAEEKPYTLQSLQASERIAGMVKRTPLLEANKLCYDGLELYLKAENMQRQRSFKVRGALNAILQRNPMTYDSILTVSAGNHAQGVTLAANIVGKPVIVIMPKHASAKKVEATQKLGAEVLLMGNNFDEASQATARMREKDTGLFYVAPFDDLDVIEGNGTQALEVRSQQSQLDRAYMAVGGYGQIAGTAPVLREQYGSNMQVVGVQLENVDPFCDGTAVRQPGELALSIVRKDNHVARIIHVTKRQLAQAMLDLTEFMDSPVEPAGALALAGLRKEIQEAKSGTIPQGKVVLLVSGGNLTNETYEQAKGLAA